MLDLGVLRGQMIAVGRESEGWGLVLDPLAEYSRNWGRTQEGAGKWPWIRSI